jgi:hypothetical protein
MRDASIHRDYDDDDAALAPETVKPDRHRRLSRDAAHQF